MALIAADPRGELVDLAFEIREHHVWARPADEVGVERRSTVVRVAASVSDDCTSWPSRAWTSCSFAAE